MDNNTHQTSAQAANDVVCHCRQIDRLTLEQSIRHGARSLDAIIRQTGAGSECGCCQVYIKELLGEKLWLPVSLASIHRYSDNYCAFRFVRADGGRWSQEKPGAYFIFQSLINGAWIGRPYAITDDGVESGFREITVKRKAGGFYSNWLFDHLDTLADAPLRISASVGGSAFNPDNPKPIICFVGGVGITPALSLCRMLANNQVAAKICLDYSASNEEDFFCRDELLRIAQRSPLSINFRQTASSGRIQQADVDVIVQQHPDENFYVCGPDSYKTTVIELLRNRDVTPSQIIDLESTHTEAEIRENRTPTAEANMVWDYRVVGVLLLAAYGLQDAFGLKLVALEQLQNEHNYKIISGLLLLVYVMMQWHLPIARWLKLDNDKLAVRKHRHQYFGAIAPLVFYLHACSIGYAYLAVLSSVYLANSLLGYGSGEFIADAYKRAYVFGWTIMHIGLSTSLLFLSGYHTYIAFAYK